MTPRYLIDSDWAIHHLKGEPRTQARLQMLMGDGVGISVIALAELYEGVYGATNPSESERMLLEFLKDVELVGIDDETARQFGRLRGQLRTQGTLIPDFDLMIGATAMRHDLTLLTNNRQHFERITGLRIESLA